MRITGPLLIPRNRMRSGTGAASPYAGLMGVAVICGGLMACMGALIGLIKGKEYLDVRHLTNESAAHHAAANPQNKDKLRDIFNAVLKSGAIVHDMEGSYLLVFKIQKELQFHILRSRSS